MLRPTSISMAILAVLLPAACAAAEARTAAPGFSVSPSELVAGEPATPEFTVPAPPGGIAVGGKVRFVPYLKPWDGLIKGLSEDKSVNLFVSAERSDGGPVEVVNALPRGGWTEMSGLEAVVRDTPLAEGQSIRVRFGTEENPVRPLRKQRSLWIEAELDADGDGKAERLLPPDLLVRAGAPVRLHLVAQSIAVAGEPVRLVAHAEDRSGNVCEQYEATLALTVGGGEGGPAGADDFAMQAWPDGAELFRNETTLTFATPGIYTVSAKDAATGFAASSNPVRVLANAPAERLYWGEVHVHSQRSDGLGEPADVLRDAYARGLDFVALTDHGFGRGVWGGLAERLVDVCAETERRNRPGTFVTIPSAETHYLPQTHMNLYFAEADAVGMKAVADRLQANRPSGSLVDADAEARREGVRGYWEALGSPDETHNPLAVPPHTLWIGLIEFANGPRQRVIEIQSGVGSSEVRDQSSVPKWARMNEDRIRSGEPNGNYSVRELLATGQRVGFIAGSDDHRGQAGRGQITAVYAPELTRAAILDAIWQRRCYATSRGRTIVEFRTGATPMGQAVAAGKAGTFECFVAPQGKATQLEIIADGDTVLTRPFGEGASASFAWTPEEMPAGYCYLRVILGDSGLAWSSPIWLE